MKPNFAIGIDAGTKTGFAVWNIRAKQFYKIETIPIHRALELVKDYHMQTSITVIVEDARQVKFKTSPEKAQGAGSVKRDAAIWEAFLKDHGIPHEMKRPNKSITKWSEEMFRKTTKFIGQTNEHGRDAAMLVYGM